MAGLDQSQAEKYYNIFKLVAKLNYASIEVARRYIDGKSTKEGAIDELIFCCLGTPKSAERGLKFFKQYRSYIITYPIGKEIIQNYIEKNGGTEDNPEKRWELFVELLSTPLTPSGLL